MSSWAERLDVATGERRRGERDGTAEAADGGGPDGTPDDCDIALRSLRGGDTGRARALLRRVIDAGVPGRSGRACVMLALLEYGAGDADQADELLEYAAGGDGFDGFTAAVHRILMGTGGPPHPLLTALVEQQALGGEAGTARLEQCAAHPDPAVAAPAKAMLARTRLPSGEGVRLLGEAAAQGDPLALSYAAVLAWTVRDGDADGAAIELLRRAHARGRPELAPWVARALDAALEGRNERDRPADAAERAVPRGREDDRAGVLGPLTEDDGAALLAELHLALFEWRPERVRSLLGRAASAGHAERAAGMVGSAAVERLHVGADGARELYELVLESGPPAQVARVCEAFGHAHELAGDAEAAVAALRRGAGVGHPAALACLHRLVLLGGRLAEDGRPADAAEAFGAAAAAARRHPEPAEDEREVRRAALDGLASVARRAGEAGDAALAVRALRLAAEGGAPGDAVEIARRYAADAAEHGDLDTVRTYYLGAAEFPPDGGPSLLIELAGVLAEHGARDEARALLEPLAAGEDAAVRLAASLRLEPLLTEDEEPPAPAAPVTADLEAAFGLAERGDLAGAIAAFGRVAALDPAEDAADDLRDAVRVATSNVVALAVRAAEAGEHEAARRGLVAGARAGMYSDTFFLAWEAALRCVAAGDVPAAHAYYATALDLPPGPGGPYPDIQRDLRESWSVLPAARPGLQDLYEALGGGDPGAVRRVLERLSGTADAGPAGQTVIAVSRARRATDPEDARRLLAPVTEFAPPEQAAVAWDDLGDLTDDPAAAVEAYRCGAAIDHPAARTALRSLAWAHVAEGDLDAAEAAAWRAVATGDPATVVCGYRVLGQVHGERGDLDGAARFYRQGLQRYEPFGEGLPSEQDERAGVLRMRLDLADVLQRQGHDDAAKAEAERVREEARDDDLAAEAGARLGRIMYQAGDLAGALEAYERVALPVPADRNSPLAGIAAAAAEDVTAIVAEAGAAGDRALAVRALAVAAEGADGDAVAAALRAARLAAGDDPGAARAFLESLTGVNTESDGVVRAALATLPTAAPGEDGDPQTEPYVQAEPYARDEPYAGDKPYVREEPYAQAEPYAQEEPYVREEPYAQDEPYARGESYAREHGGSEEEGEVGSLERLMRGQAGGPSAGAAGRRLIRAAHDLLNRDPARARRILEMVTEHGDPAEAATAYDLLGDIHSFVEDDMDAAIAAYRSGAAIDHPAALAPLRGLMAALLQAEDYDGVAEVAQHAVSSGDAETVAVGYWLWGDSRGFRGDSDGAKRLYRRGIDVGHPEITPRVRVDLARTLRDRGEDEPARTEIALAAASEDREVRAHAGTLAGQWAYEDGDLAAAAEAFGAVAALGTGTAPGGPEGQAELIEMAADNVIVVADRAFDEDAHAVAVRALTLAARAGRVSLALTMAGERAAALAAEGDRAGAMLYAEGAAGFTVRPDPGLEVRLADLFVTVGEHGRARAVYERLAAHSDAKVRQAASGRLEALGLTRHDPGPGRAGALLDGPAEDA
ncbi:hypothetical protein ACFY4C_17960 [Actinomadura viridis]|uniref:hypothetical protein n=1 Tax=Actinomadura viridis TaxID=58110 RepID=UPI0036BF0F9D